MVTGGSLLEARGRLGGGLLAVLEIGADDFVAVEAVDREDDQDREVGDQHGPVEPRQLVDPGERCLGEQIVDEANDDGMRREQRQN